MDGTLLRGEVERRVVIGMGLHRHRYRRSICSIVLGMRDGHTGHILLGQMGIGIASLGFGTKLMTRKITNEHRVWAFWKGILQPLSRAGIGLKGGT